MPTAPLIHSLRRSRSVSCCSGVPSSSTQHSAIYSTGTVSFLENTAIIDGGAIQLTYPAQTFIADVNFGSNQGMFGGAVALKSTAESSVELEWCQFESNNASRGGALYFIGEGRNFIRDSRFYQNVAGENSPRGVACFGISNEFQPWNLGSFNVGQYPKYVRANIAQCCRNYVWETGILSPNVWG